MAYSDKIIPVEIFNSQKNTFINSAKKNLRSLGSESVWWSIDDIEGFISQVRSEAVADGKELSGIRFTFIISNIEKERLSLALVPTCDDNCTNSVLAVGSVMNKGDII